MPKTEVGRARLAIKKLNKEIEEINKVNTSLRPLSNSKVRFRTRIMWQVKSPFVTWGVGNFIVDRQGKVLR